MAAVVQGSEWLLIKRVSTCTVYTCVHVYSVHMHACTVHESSYLSLLDPTPGHGGTVLLPADTHTNACNVV